MLTHEDQPQRWYASESGGNAYRPAKLTGLGDNLHGSMAGRVLVTAPGVYLAYETTALYRSAGSGG